MRLNTNKLYSLAHLLTNLHRKVCIGASVTPTNSTGMMRYKGRPVFGTNYVFESTYGTGYTPSYYTGYVMGDILDDLLSTDGQTDEAYFPDASLLSTFDFWLTGDENGESLRKPKCEMGRLCGGLRIFQSNGDDPHWMHAQLSG